MNSIFNYVKRMFSSRNPDSENPPRVSTAVRVLLAIFVAIAAVDAVKGFMQGRAETCCGASKDGTK